MFRDVNPGQNVGPSVFSRHDPLDRADVHHLHGAEARADGVAVDIVDVDVIVPSSSSALGDPTPSPEDPNQRHVGGNDNVLVLAIDMHVVLPSRGPSATN